MIGEGLAGEVQVVGDAGAGFDEVEGLRVQEVEEVVATVASGRGWSIVPEDCTRHPAAKRAITLRHPRHRVHNQIYAVTRASAREHATTASIFEALASAARR